MNKTIPLFLVFFICSCGPQTVSEDQLVERYGLHYEFNSLTPFSGKVVERYENGQLNTEKTFKDGKLDGLHVVHFEAGQLKLKETYKDGKRNGWHVTYFENGQLRLRASFKNGELEGPYEAYDEEGGMVYKRELKNP